MYGFYNNDMTYFIKTTCGGYRTDFTDNFFLRFIKYKAPSMITREII